MNRMPSLTVWILAFLVSACTVKAVGDPERPITIKAHILVDIRELKDTATGIESMIEEGATQPAAAAQPTRLALLKAAARWLEPKVAYAEGGYDLKEITPELKVAFKGRKERYSKLATLKSMEKLGENNEGLITNLSGDNSLDQFVFVENRNREAIYQAIVKQNGLAPREIYTVRSVFADVQRGKSKPGEKIQMPNGEWVTKS